MLCDLAEELRRHDLRLGVNVKLKTLKIFLQIDSQRRDVLIEELTKTVPHVPTAAEEREVRRSSWKVVPATDEVPAGKLRLTVFRAGRHLPSRTPQRQGPPRWRLDLRRRDWHPPTLAIVTLGSTRCPPLTSTSGKAIVGGEHTEPDLGPSS